MGFNKKHVHSDTIKSFIESDNLNSLIKSIKKADAVFTSDEISSKTIDIIYNNELSEDDKPKMIRNLFIL
jgi:hypothetical protein|tara:strand:- start:2488 stop:2697 length:210 start_codon:yes stop_codon:yes gene_type:complete